MVYYFFFGILFQGFKALLQHYLQTDRLSFGYFFLLGIPSALISIVIERFTYHRSRTFRILIIIILLAIVLIMNLV